MNQEQNDEVVQLYLDDIIPNRFQPREVFDEKALKELAVSIKEHGVIQPIIVRNVNGKYEIIAGERRYKASALAGLTKIPAIIRNLDDKESSKVALLENLQRKDLNPIEEARTYQKILEIDQMTQEELARTMGKSQSAVANKIRLLSLPEEIQTAVLKEEISERHARALLNIPDNVVQRKLLQEVIDTKMSVRKLEDEIKAMYPKEKEESEMPISNSVSTSGFLNDQPLQPTTTSELPEQSSNYGKVVLAPPKVDNPEEREEQMQQNRFINYGEIEKEESNSNLNVGMDGSSLPDSAPELNLNQIKEDTTDIINKSSGAALDNLLNITPSAETKSIFPSHENSLFNSQELPSITIDDGQGGIENKSMPLGNGDNQLLQPEAEEPQQYTVEEATQKIKDVVDDLKLHGISINADEMNFPKSYQIIIKIDKDI